MRRYSVGILSTCSRALCSLSPRWVARASAVRKLRPLFKAPQPLPGNIPRRKSRMNFMLGCFKPSHISSSRGNLFPAVDGQELHKRVSFRSCSEACDRYTSLVHNPPQDEEETLIYLMLGKQVHQSSSGRHFDIPKLLKLHDSPDKFQGNRPVAAVLVIHLDIREQGVEPRHVAPSHTAALLSGTASESTRVSMVSGPRRPGRGVLGHGLQACLAAKLRSLRVGFIARTMRR